MSKEKCSRATAVIGGFFLHVVPNLAFYFACACPVLSFKPWEWWGWIIFWVVQIGWAGCSGVIFFGFEQAESDWHKTGEMKYEVKYDSSGKKYNVSGEPVWEDRNHADSKNFFTTLFGWLVSSLFGFILYIICCVKSELL